MLNQEMQNAINGSMAEQTQIQPEQTEQVDTTWQQVEQQSTEQPEQPQEQQFDPNWNQQPTQPAQTEVAEENNTVTPEQDVTTATPEPQEEQPKAFSRDEELNELENMLKWNQTPEQPEAQPETEPEKEVPEEPISDEENLNYKVKWKEEASKTAQLEAENYRLQQQLKYANLELEDSTNRYGTLKDRQMELNNDIESLKNKVTPDDLIDLTDKYRVWTNVPNDATSVQLVQTICQVLTRVTGKNADWIFEDYLATRTNKDIPFTSSHSDNTSMSNSGRGWDNRISL